MCNKKWGKNVRYWGNIKKINNKIWIRELQDYWHLSLSILGEKNISGHQISSNRSVESGKEKRWSAFKTRGKTLEEIQEIHKYALLWISLAIFYFWITVHSLISQPVCKERKKKTTKKCQMKWNLKISFSQGRMNNLILGSDRKILTLQGLMAISSGLGRLEIGFVMFNILWISINRHFQGKNNLNYRTYILYYIYNILYNIYYI